ncbi:N-formylglutamate amidohydrolase [Loktanella sp. IMCC34160]|uniref:N-formylglutamate amidohydrolase n=1 Tax=Loktanella sp. IMCC34160 TaxID=2510646 RepID=UPI00101D1C52|nr:N-formylglutamate amidohydrolase [Loktanella sp. IMCC34160]RYG89522.1 N-formylglutamate amidohydrolase [Loktanella sp. IMCC34160]
MAPDSYRLSLPIARETSVVFGSPHSGSLYPEAFLNRAILDKHTIRSSEDAFVDDLFSAVPQHGAPLLVAGMPRAYVDLNRGPDELDPALIDGLRRPAHNPRVASGLGVVPRVVANGRPIYRGKLTMEEAHSRISNYWRPYHDQLQTLLDQSRNRFGHSILIDCHSMPREALDAVGPAGADRPQVVLGDRFGASASHDIVERIEAAFAAAGFRVARNMPFAGAYICQTYGRPSRGQHAVQVEIDRSLYMDEARIEPLPGYADFKARIDQVVRDICTIGAADLDQPMAAE